MLRGCVCVCVFFFCASQWLSTLKSYIRIQVQTSVETSRRDGEGLMSSHCLLPQKREECGIGFQRYSPLITVNIPAYLVSLDKPSPAEGKQTNKHIKSCVEAGERLSSSSNNSSSRLLCVCVYTWLMFGHLASRHLCCYPSK